MKIKVIEKLGKEYRKLKNTYSFYRGMTHPRLDIYDDDLVKTKIKDLLFQYNHPSITNTVILEEICKAVTDSVNGLKDKPRLKSLAEIDQTFLGDVKYRYSIVCAVASMLEMNLKFFGNKLEIKVYQEKRDDELIIMKSFKDIAVGISKKYPRLSVDFEFLADLRNSLIHCNLKQLKDLLWPKLTQEQKDQLKGAWSISLNNQNGDNIVWSNDKLSKDQAIDMGPFFWFLSECNSKILDYTTDYLEDAISDITALTELHSISFEETNGFFDQLAVKGERFTNDQKELIKKCRGQYMMSKNHDKRISRYESLFRLE